MPRRHEAIEGQMNASTEGDYGHGHHTVEIRVIRGDEPRTVIILLPNAPRFRKMADEHDIYDWTDADQAQVTVSGLLDALEGLGQLEKLPNGSFRIPNNPPFGK